MNSSHTTRVHTVELTTGEIVTLAVALAMRLQTTNEITRPQVIEVEAKLYRLMGLRPPKDPQSDDPRAESQP